MFDGENRVFGSHRSIATLALIGLVSAWTSPPSHLLAQNPPIPLDTLQVQVSSRASSQLPVLTRSVKVFGRNEILALPVRTVSDLLGWATGVEIQARSPAQSDLGIRGAGSEQVVVLVDGVRVSDPQTAHFDLDLAVPLDQVERVEVLRGPASAVYGADAVGGVVNLVTRGGANGWIGRIEGGSWGGAKISVTGRAPFESGSMLRVSGEFSRSDGHRPGTDHQTLLVHLGLRRPTETGELAGEFGAARRDFGARDFYAPYPSYEETRSYTSALRWKGRAGEQTEFEMIGSLRRHEDEFTLIRADPGAYQNRHASWQMGGEAFVRGRTVSALSVVFGGEAFRELLRSNSLGDRGETRGALFVEAVLGDGGPGVLSAGVRQDWHQGFGGFLSPSFSGSVRLGSSVRGRVAVGRSFRAPSWTERYYEDPVNVGRADLEPERAWSGEIGFDLAAGNGLKVSLTAFARRAEDLIDWARPVAEGGGGGDSPPPWETRNVEKATFKGIEAEANGRLPFGFRWNLGGMWLNVDSEEVAGFTSKYSLRPLAEQITAGLEKSVGASAFLGVKTQRARRHGEEAYLRMDGRFGYRVGRAGIYLDVTNVLNEEYPDITGSRAPGRAVFVGLEMSTTGRGR